MEARLQVTILVDLYRFSIFAYTLIISLRFFKGFQGQVHSLPSGTNFEMHTVSRICNDNVSAASCSQAYSSVFSS